MGKQKRLAFFLPFLSIYLKFPGFVLIINIFSVKIAARFLDIISSLKLVVLAVVVITALSRIIQHGGTAV